MQATHFTRRGFLGGSVAALAALPAVPAWGRPSGGERARRSYWLREQAAREELAASEQPERDNGDERLYANFIGNYSKGLPHDAYGVVDRDAYRSLQRALKAAPSAAAFERVRLGGDQKLVNPMAGAAFDLEGVDIQKLATTTPPALASEQRAAEMVELYWMALCRDLPFSGYAKDATAQAAGAELGVAADRLFRGVTAGDAVGPYVSQLFLTPFAYGQYLLDGRITVFTRGTDYLTDPGAWLACRNGAGPFVAPRMDSEPRYFRCGRDLASFVHSDQGCEAFYNAGLRLYALGAPSNPGNPYLRLQAQAPFATFGPPHFLTLQAEAALRAVKAVFYQKWFVHRTLRPEEFGGLVQATMTGQADHPLHDRVLRSESAAATFARWKSWLLPQAFPEGCPQHPSYTQAHGGVAGACATILKAAFDGTTPWLSLGATLKQSSTDGLNLDDYSGSDEAAITVNGEIEKLCSNIALARNFAGVHWRSDYEAGLRLGEAMALTILADQRRTYGEAFSGFTLTRFDGSTITV
jgi:hypothetical protein